MTPLQSVLQSNPLSSIVFYLWENAISVSPVSFSQSICPDSNSKYCLQKIPIPHYPSSLHEASDCLPRQKPGRAAKLNNVHAILCIITNIVPPRNGLNIGNSSLRRKSRHMSTHHSIPVSTHRMLEVSNPFPPRTLTIAIKPQEPTPHSVRIVPLPSNLI